MGLEIEEWETNRKLINNKKFLLVGGERLTLDFVA